MGKGFFLFGWVILAVSACGGSQSSRRAEPGPDEALYLDRCGRCHDAFPRHAYGKSEWPAVVQRMRFEARLTEPEFKQLVDWLSKGSE